MRLRSELIVGLASGAIVGSVLGLLLAPKKGEETRETLKNQITNAKERLSRKGLPHRMSAVGAGQSREA